MLNKLIKAKAFFKGRLKGEKEPSVEYFLFDEKYIQLIREYALTVEPAMKSALQELLKNATPHWKNKEDYSQVSYVVRYHYIDKVRNLIANYKEEVICTK